MKKKILQSLLISFCATFILLSCNNPNNGAIFKTKEDSLAFAKTVYKAYPLENRVSIGFAKLNKDSMPGMAPLTWPMVLQYREYYDAEPLLFDLEGMPYKGFGINAEGYQMLKANDKIKGLYIRLGRRGDGSFTFMVLATDIKGDLLQDSLSKKGAPINDNFDHLDPCPSSCPSNFDNGLH